MFLNECFQDKWIGKGGFPAWPPRSPDLELLDFFLWGYVTNTIYQEKNANIQTLQHRITVVTTTVTKVMLVNTWCETRYHFSTC
jgi:hypothetical protein